MTASQNKLLSPHLLKSNIPICPESVWNKLQYACFFAVTASIVLSSCSAKSSTVTIASYPLIWHCLAKRHPDWCWRGVKIPFLRTDYHRRSRYKLHFYNEPYFFFAGVIAVLIIASLQFRNTLDCGADSKILQYSLNIFVRNGEHTTPPMTDDDEL